MLVALGRADRWIDGLAAQAIASGLQKDLLTLEILRSDLANGRCAAAFKQKKAFCGIRCPVPRGQMLH